MKLFCLSQVFTVLTKHKKCLERLLKPHIQTAVQIQSTDSDLAKVTCLKINVS